MHRAAVASFATHPNVGAAVLVSANPATCAVLGQQLDFEAGDAFRGRAGLDAAGAGLMDRMIAIASGRLTWDEVLKEGDGVLSRFAPAL